MGSAAQQSVAAGLGSSDTRWRSGRFYSNKGRYKFILKMAHEGASGISAHGVPSSRGRFSYPPTTFQASAKIKTPTGSARINATNPLAARVKVKNRTTGSEFSHINRFLNSKNMFLWGSRLMLHILNLGKGRLPFTAFLETVENCRVPPTLR
jgi:hypothetical protein